MAVGPTDIYSSKSWTLLVKHRAYSSLKMRFPRRIENTSKRDRIRNEAIKQQLKIGTTHEKLVEGQFKVVWTHMPYAEERIIKGII